MPCNDGLRSLTCWHLLPHIINYVLINQSLNCLSTRAPSDCMISIGVLMLVKLIIYDIIDTVECGNFHSGLMSLLVSISLQTITVLTLVLQNHPGGLGVLVPPTVSAGLDDLMKFGVSLRYCDASKTFLQQTPDITTKFRQRRRW